MLWMVRLSTQQVGEQESRFKMTLAVVQCKIRGTCSSNIATYRTDDITKRGKGRLGSNSILFKQHLAQENDWNANSRLRSYKGFQKF